MKLFPRADVFKQETKRASTSDAARCRPKIASSRLRMVRLAPTSVWRCGLRDSGALRGCAGAAGVDAAPGCALPRAALRMPQSQNQSGREPQHHAGEPLLSLRLPELRHQPSAAGPGLPTAQMGRRAPLPGASPFLSSVPRLHRARPGGRACGPHLRGSAFGWPQGAPWTGCPMWAGDGTRSRPQPEPRLFHENFQSPCGSCCSETSGSFPPS